MVCAEIHTHRHTCPDSPTHAHTAHADTTQIHTCACTNACTQLLAAQSLQNLQYFARSLWWCSHSTFERVWLLRKSLKGPTSQPTLFCHQLSGPFAISSKKQALASPCRFKSPGRDSRVTEAFLREGGLPIRRGLPPHPAFTLEALLFWPVSSECELQEDSDHFFRIQFCPPVLGAIWLKGQLRKLCLWSRNGWWTLRPHKHNPLLASLPHQPGQSAVAT